MMWLVYIALALAIIIMLYVIYSIIKNIIRQTKEPIMSEKAEVSRKNKENKIVNVLNTLCSNIWRIISISLFTLMWFLF